MVRIVALEGILDNFQPILILEDLLSWGAILGLGASQAMEVFLAVEAVTVEEVILVVVDLMIHTLQDK